MLAKDREKTGMTLLKVVYNETKNTLIQAYFMCFFLTEILHFDYAEGVTSSRRSPGRRVEAFVGVTCNILMTAKILYFFIVPGTVFLIVRTSNAYGTMRLYGSYGAGFQPAKAKFGSTLEARTTKVKHIQCACLGWKSPHLFDAPAMALAAAEGRR